MKRNLRSIALGAALSLIASTPSLAVSAPQQQPLSGSERKVLLAELAKNNAKWTRAKITNYNAEVRVQCFCPESVALLSVRKGVPGKLRPIKGTIFDATPNSIDALFRFAQESLATADSVTITYDTKYGFPTSVYADRSFQMADEELGYSLSGFSRTTKR